MVDRRSEILEVLRGRILRGVHSGALRAGDRLPAARELAEEFDVDHRLVLDAYRGLVSEDLVELRPRGGIYVAARTADGSGVPPLPESWFAELLTEGLAREIPAAELHEWLRRCTETLRLRAAVISSTADQVYGLCRELRDDFRLEAEGLVPDEVQNVVPVPLPIRRADLLIATEAHEGWVRRLAVELRKPITIIKVRPDLHVGEWALLLRRPVYAVVATPAFADMLRDFFSEVPGAAENLHVLVFGRDDLSAIPNGAPTYVTRGVRAQLAGVAIPGRLLPAARTIAAESAREIFNFIVRSNIEAMRRLAK